MIYGFITNEKQTPEHNEYTYKACRKKQYIESQKRLMKQTRNILAEMEHNLFRQQDWSEWKYVQGKLPVLSTTTSSPFIDAGLPVSSF